MAQEARFGILIEAQSRTSELGRAAQEVARYEQELGKLKRSSDISAESHQRLGKAILEHQAAQARFREALTQSGAGLGRLSQEAQAAAGALAALPGPLGQAAAQAASLTSGATSATAALGPLAVGAAALVGLGAAALTASQFIGRYQESLDLAAESTGLTTREVAGLQLGAANIGRDFGTVEPAVLLFTRRLGEAQLGTEDAVASFRALGVSLTDAQGKFRSTGSILEEAARKLDGIQNVAERNRIAGELFGRSFSSVIAVLRQDMAALAADAEQKGLVFSGSQEQMARDADVAWDRMKASLKGLRNQIALTLAPVGTLGANLINFALPGRGEAENFYGGAYTGKIIEPPVPPAERARIEAERVRGVETTMHGPLLPTDAATKAQLAYNAALEDFLGKAREAAAAERNKEAERIKAIESKVHGPTLDAATKAQLAYTKSVEEFSAKLADPMIPQSLKDIAAAASDLPGAATAQAFSKINTLIDQMVDQELKLQEVRKRGLMQIPGLQAAANVGVRRFFTSVIEGTESAKQAFGELFKYIAEQIAIETATKAVLSILGLQAGGTITGANVAFARAGGSLGSFEPVRAQSGMNMRGIRGVDSVRGLWGQGETILSHQLTDSLARNSRFLDRMERAQASGPQSTQIVNNNYSVQPHLHTPFLDRQTLRQFLRDEVSGMVIDDIRKGVYRRP